MIYVALLRGINVGGNNKIDMKMLTATLARVGMKSVVTYINSGNVIFVDELHTKTDITELLEKAIFEDFKLDIKVLIRSLDDFESMMKILPESWKNDKEMKSDILFLWEEVDQETVDAKLVINPQIDTVLYTPGEILWSVHKDNMTQSGLVKIVGTALYKKVTVRNVNTARKVYEIMLDIKRNML